jgi:hypothetical protein
MAESKLDKHYTYINENTYIQNMNKGLVIDPTRRIIRSEERSIKKLKKDQNNFYSRLS